MTPETSPAGAALPAAAARKSVDPGRALHAALCHGGRRIHIDVTAQGVRLRSRLAGHLRQIAFLPGESGHALVALLEQTARDGVGSLALDGGKRTLRYRLAQCEGAAIRTLVLTLLPSAEDAPAADLVGLGLPDDHLATLRADLDRRRGLVLVAGTPGSGRSHTLRAAAGEADPRHESVLLVAYDPDDAIPQVDRPIVHLDLREELWSLLEEIDTYDPDWLVMPEIRSPLHATLALALSGGRRRAFAPIRAQDTAGALVKMRELASDRYRAARDLVGVLAQHRLPRPCPQCSESRDLLADEVPEVGWDLAARRQLLARSPRLRRRGTGCDSCMGSGYSGWTYLFEYLSIDDAVAEHVRSTLDPGRLREELKGLMAGRGMLDAAWREALRGNVELEELNQIPGPEVVPFHLRRVPADDVPAPPAPAEARTVSEPEAAAPSSAAPKDAPVEGVYARSCESLGTVLSTMKTGDRIEDGVVEQLSAQLVEAVEKDPGLVQAALRGGPGDDVVRHQINTTVLAIKIALGMSWERRDLLRLAIAGLVHDAGLMKVPPQVLERERRLTKKEQVLRRRHVEWTEEMVRASLPGRPWLPRVVGQVHERESGKGYPRGLAGDAIDPLAKVLALADTLESMTHPRPGRPALTTFDVMQRLMKEHSAEFDPKVVRAMVRQVSLFPVGSWVRLNNGSIARVTSINTDNFYRPKVEIVSDAAGRRVESGTPMDLADAPFLHITGPLQDAALGNVGEAR